MFDFGDITQPYLYETSAINVTYNKTGHKLINHPMKLLRLSLINFAESLKFITLVGSLSVAVGHELINHPSSSNGFPLLKLVGGHVCS